VVVRTCHQGDFSRSQGLLPLLGGRALLRIFVPVNEAAKDQLDQGRMQMVEAWGPFWRLDPRVWDRCVRENTLGNASFDGRWVTAAQPLGSEGVAALHKKLEDEHAQGKCIMLWLAHDAADDLVMQLRRGVLQLADRTRVGHDLIAAASCTWKHFLYLERIRVNQADQG
jgi:hypothetical protein